MSGQITTGEQTIAAVYDTAAHAELAVQDLLQAKVPPSAIERHTEAGSYSGGIASEPVRKPGGFLSNLFGTDSHDDAPTYVDSMSKGGTVVTVHGIPHGDYQAIAAILEAHDPIDFDDRAAPVTAPLAGRATTANDEKLQLSEESLVVGKRLVNQGGTRIRRYVVETPVEQQVSLHDERVVLDRHPVTDGRAVDAAAFSENDKVIEMTETTEQAVVGKTARVVEEVSLRREGVDRSETIHDTVRKEEVDVERVANTDAGLDPTRKV